MENKEQACGCDNTTNKCGMMVTGCTYKHKVLKKLLMLLVMIVIFNLGVKMGELKGMLKAYNNNSYKASQNSDYGYRMMGGFEGNSVN